MCKRPLHAFYLGYKTEKGGKAYKICGGDVNLIHQPVADIIPDKVISKFAIYGRNVNCNLITEYEEIPCGKCIECRLNDTRKNAVRCYLESLEWDHNYMITMTYDNEHVPHSEETDLLTLKEEDSKNFIKRVAEYWGRVYNHKTEYLKDLAGDFILNKKGKKIVVQPGMRYFYCGEYGGSDPYTDENGERRTGTERPHYHILAFNLPIFDLKPFFLNKYGQQVYTSEKLTKLWGMGHVTVCEVNWNTCAYVARYIMKKQKGPDAEEYYQARGIAPEFVRMSLKPGIGYGYYIKHKEEIFSKDEIVIQKYKIDERYELKKETVHVKPPRYFTKLLETEDPEFVEELKAHRKECAKANKEMEMSRTTLSPEEYMAQAERKLMARMKNIRHEMFKEQTV